MFDNREKTTRHEAHKGRPAYCLLRFSPLILLAAILVALGGFFVHNAPPASAQSASPVWEATFRPAQSTTTPISVLGCFLGRTITVTAYDGNGGSVDDSFTVTVKAAPVVASAIADLSGMEVGDSQDVSLSGVFSDADTLTFTAETSDSAVADALLFQGTLTLFAVADGSATVTVTTQDADGNAARDTFDMKVVGPPTPVSNLSCVAQTGRVLVSWNAPEWSGAAAYPYAYDLTLPDGRREQSRLLGYPAVSGKGEYQAVQAASISVKAVYELADGSKVSSKAATLTCTMAE